MRLSGKKRRLRVEHRGEEFSPMEGVGNMADAMLVFACGLIVALILNWNVNLADTEQSMEREPENKYEIDNIQDNVDTTINESSPLQEMGRVYLDPSTGKYYVVEGQ